ncbi:hypothetical protein Slin15195_G020480 [Septoria linicola]|uniref:Uncharacterized protein n=1 Tax=Septoria linicola TaxID=215465 RepID=A0A9Q9AJ02_9PEZI|nr:hypothetical protein Slin14017_G020550 [Septoria linicola]USW48729.1 hypothetical protein Slin15195_G020480 [Septoria linicola]
MSTKSKKAVTFSSTAPEIIKHDWAFSHEEIGRDSFLWFDTISSESANENANNTTNSGGASRNETPRPRTSLTQAGAEHARPAAKRKLQQSLKFLKQASSRVAKYRVPSFGMAV